MTFQKRRTLTFLLGCYRATIHKMHYQTLNQCVTGNTESITLNLVQVTEIGRGTLWQFPSKVVSACDKPFQWWRSCWAEPLVHLGDRLRMRWLLQMGLPQGISIAAFGTIILRRDAASQWTAPGTPRKQSCNPGSTPRLPSSGLPLARTSHSCRPPSV